MRVIARLRRLEVWVGAAAASPWFQKAEITLSAGPGLCLEAREGSGFRPVPVVDLISFLVVVGLRCRVPAGCRRGHREHATVLHAGPCVSRRQRPSSSPCARGLCDPSAATPLRLPPLLARTSSALLRAPVLRSVPLAQSRVISQP